MTSAALVLLAMALTPGPAGHSPGAGPAQGDSGEVRFLRDLDHLTTGTGRWLTDNGAYVSDDEPWRSYGLEWTKGLSGRTGHGRLFGVGADGSERNFWEFYLYWDAVRQRAVTIQMHTSGALFGAGEMVWTGEGTQELVQTFRSADGTTGKVKHVERADGDRRHSQSFDWVDGAWKPRRTYVWIREPGPRTR